MAAALAPKHNWVEQCSDIDWEALRERRIPAILPPPEECIEYARDTVLFTVWRFWQNHGGDLDAMAADAWYYWLKGDREYRRAHETKRAVDKNYLTEIKRWVWFELFDEYRTRTQHRRKDENKLVIKADEHIETRLDTQNEFNFTDFLDELSYDGQVVIRMLFDTAGELTQHGRRIATVAAAKGGTGLNMRSTLRAYLAACGWAGDRINEAFSEIGEALVA